MDNQMLSLTEYSSRHRVSISTLRRRIKSNDIPYVFKDGKYFIIGDEDNSTPASDADVRTNHRPSQVHGSPSLKNSDSDVGVSAIKDLNTLNAEDSLLNAANRLLTELKKAYSQILHEKEEQILVLKEEISDLKTLAKVLEAENNRLRQL
jgi:hypothetical protein